MIICHKYKFIFLHVPKTGGSSITTFFSQYLGDRDILSGWNNPLRRGIPYNSKTLRMVNNKFGLRMISKALNLRAKDHKIFERPIIEYALREVLKKKIGTNSAHATANHLKNFDQDSWRKYFKFAFVRNPYTHAISNWMWSENDWSIVDNNVSRKKKLTKKNFVNYLKKLKKDLRNNNNYYYDKLPGNQIYTINNKIAVDFIGKFENLEKDVLKIKKVLKLPKEKFKLEYSKKNSSINNLNYYTKESRKLVEDIWKKELQLFKYQFPNK